MNNKEPELELELELGELTLEEYDFYFFSTLEEKKELINQKIKEILDELY